MACGRHPGVHSAPAPGRSPPSRMVFPCALKGGACASVLVPPLPRLTPGFLRRFRQESSVRVDYMVLAERAAGEPWTWLRVATETPASGVRV